MKEGIWIGHGWVLGVGKAKDFRPEGKYNKLLKEITQNEQ